MPVMEGKAILFKAFADVDAFPICLSSTDTEEIIQAIKMIAPTFGGINLEDISAPRCIEIENRLRKELDIPVFHDDQHGTAIVVCAGLINALKLIKKSISELKIVVNGAGAAGSAIVKMLISLGATNIIICDTKGILHKDMDTRGNFLKDELCKLTNPNQLKGTLRDAIKDADAFIGVSAADTVDAQMVESMAKDAIIFAMANPTPEIMPDIALLAGAKVVGTGRSDFANQINNVLAFPGIFRGALDVRASDINEAMKIAATYAIANIIPEEKLSPLYIIPDALDKEVAKQVAKAVAEAAIKSGVARI
jgi:malate dehydrogenase (oxaloacetate-decarboxylating)